MVEKSNPEKNTVIGSLYVFNIMIITQKHFKNFSRLRLVSKNKSQPPSRKVEVTSEFLAHSEIKIILSFSLVPVRAIQSDQKNCIAVILSLK